MPQALSKFAKHLIHLCGRKPLATPVDMTGRRVIVTGASPNSLGFETAKMLASWGATVVATCVRNVPQMESSLKDELRKIDANENNITAHRLDLWTASMASPRGIAKSTGISSMCW